MKPQQILAICTFAALLSSLSCSSQKLVKKDVKITEPALSAPTPDSIGFCLDLRGGYATTGIMKDSMQTAWVLFHTPGGEALYGKITLPGAMGNVRFNQIMMPDGSMDGPFGRDITYDLSTPGRYTLAIGESHMQGDPYAGLFTLELYTGKPVPNKPVAGYFVRNDVEDMDIRTEKITSESDFEKLFGAAATMNSIPEKIDFAKQFLVAIIGRSTDTSTEFGIETALLKDGILTVVYRQMQGEKQTFTIRPFTLISIDKEYEGALRAISTSY